MKNGTESGKTAEMIRFAVAGVACFLVEFALLVLLRDSLHLHTLLANAVAFVVSVSLNYLACLKWVFRGASGNGRTRAGFLITSLMGLALNEAVMALMGWLLGEDGVLLTLSGRTVTMYMLNKCVAAILVMIWNYLTKRRLLVKRQS